MASVVTWGDDCGSRTSAQPSDAQTRVIPSRGTFAEIVLDPLFVNLYDDPRWVPFLRRIGKAPEQLAKIAFALTPPV